jgi:cardiolipin synthase
MRLFHASRLNTWLTRQDGQVNCAPAIVLLRWLEGMRIDIILVRIFGSLLGILFLAGCANPGPRSRYLEQIEPGSLTNLIAYRGETNLEIRYPFHGKDAFAIAKWPAEEAGGADFQYRYAVLAFDKQPRATRKSLVKHGARLVIRNAGQWQTLVDEVFQGLMPSEPGHGVLVLVQNQEVALYRNEAGMARVVKLDQKPGNVIIDHAFSQSDFSRNAIELLEKSANKLDPGQNQFLFVTGKDPAFVLIDLRERLIIFLSYPIDPDSQPSDMPGWFTLRALNSLVIRGFVISAIKNPGTMITRGLWHIGTSGAAALDEGMIIADSGPPPPLYTGPGMDLAAWEKRLDDVVPARRYLGRLECLIDGEQFFPALIKSMENATRSIDVLVYIFGSDEYAVTIADVLKERASSLRVRVLLDEMGSLFGGGTVPPQSMVPPGFKHPGDIKSYLTAGSRVDVRASANPWLTSDHRKCIIIDSRQAYVGGMNIGWKYRYEWHDMMVRLTGPVVGRLEKDYGKAWAHAGLLGDFAYAWVTLFGRTHPRKNEIADGIEIRPLRTSTWHMEIFRAQLEAIRQAKSYIYIENAYFSDNVILRELIRARQRGVDVRVILPAKSDSGVMQISNLIMANEMVRHGIRVYAYPGMTHVKAAIYDGWACLGSANLEKMSLRVSQELDVAFSDPATVNPLRRDLFETDFKRAREIMEPVPVNWLDSFVKAFADEL